MNEAELELQMAGYSKHFDYSQYANNNNINVIPEADFKRLVSDTFKIIADILRATYGPYGSSVIISDQSQTTTTKDGYNVFQALGFNHTYKRMVYLAVSKIIERVNRNVGDGTTSCILLAEKMFNNLNQIIENTDDKRNILDILSNIEEDLQNESIITTDLENGTISHLTKESLKNLIMMASNGDSVLSTVVFNSLDPKTDENGYVISLRNVVPTSEITLDADSTAVYDIDYLPGDYRIRANLQVEDIASMDEPTEMKLVIYDHAFNTTDWLRFKKNFTNTEHIMILARTFSKEFLDTEWHDWYTQTLNAKRFKKGDGVIRIHLGEVRGGSVQADMRDLAAVYGMKPRGIHDGDVNHETLPTAKMSIYKTNCLAFYDLKDKDLSEYINELKIEMNNDESHSFIKAKEMRTRIESLSMTNRDTLLTVKCGTSLEAKLIMDKIDDCISIAESAMNSGTVPNILRYAYDRIVEFVGDENGTLKDKTGGAICKAIKGLFNDIWKSKFGDKEVTVNGLTYQDYCDMHYIKHEYTSFDIVSCSTVDAMKYPTSAQYDLEVVAASISIVKYLLTGRALIFDAHILPTVTDNGHYSNN